jgi:tRNA(Ile)-lysidine synthase
VRHELLPLVTQIFQRDAVTALNRQAELVALDADFLECEAEVLCRSCKRQGDEIQLTLQTLHGRPKALQLRALRRLAWDLGAQPGRGQSLRLLQLTNRPPGRRIDLGADVWAERGRDSIWIYRLQAPRPATPVSIPGATALPDGTRLSVEPAGTAPPYPDGRRHARMALPADRCAWAVRAAQAGDRMRPFGMRGSRLVFDLLAEAGVPRHRRNRSWVLTNGEEIYWLLGYRQAETGRVTPAEPTVYELSWSADA